MILGLTLGKILSKVSKNTDTDGSEVKDLSKITPPPRSDPDIDRKLKLGTLPLRSRNSARDAINGLLRETQNGSKFVLGDI